MVKACEWLPEAAKEQGKSAGMWAPSFEIPKSWIKKGVRFFETMGDVGFIASGAAELISRFPGHARKINSGEGNI